MPITSSPIITPDASTPTRWPLERILFAMAGSVVLLSVLLTVTLSSWFVLLAAFVGVNQLAYVLFRACPASLMLRRCNVESQCSW